METSDPKRLAARTWFGYGRWSAPYWFVGKEPGGADEADQYASWLRLGGTELIDCRQHDLDCSSDGSTGLWHGPEAPRLQSTWRALIATVLGYEGATSYDEAAIRAYQNERWGRVDGDTAVLELSAVAAPSVSDAEALRLSNVSERVGVLQSRIKESRPKFVVFYGLGMDPIHRVPYSQYWNEIAERHLEIDEPVLGDGTIFVAERHPTAFGTTNDHWLNLGRRLRALR